MGRVNSIKSGLIIMFLGGILMGSFAFSIKKDPPYKNPKLPVQERVKDLMSRMTLEEKFWQMFMIPGDLSIGKDKLKHGIFGFQISSKGKNDNAAEQIMDYGSTGTAENMAKEINELQKFFIKETRLGIPIIPFNEALHGLARDGATTYPQAIALAATWDTTLVGNVARAITKETKTRGIRQILSPVLNIARDVRWGRTEETYGEDPFLTTQMAVSYISQFEKEGIITSPKHFVANVGDGGRDSYPIHFNERLLEEVYFPAFKAVFQKAGARSVMTSYNSLDGTPCTSNEWLLTKKLKDEWGFKGFVISDAGAVGGANVLHFTAANYAEATEDAVEAGLDVLFQTNYNHYPLFWEAYEKGMVDIKAIDEAVRRILTIKFELGLFENPYVDAKEAAVWNGHKTHRELARVTAAKSMVLLKNENKVLPLSKSVKKMALIGYDAKAARLGGYSGPGNNVVSMLEGVSNKIGKENIIYAPGVAFKEENYQVVASSFLSTMEDGKKVEGLSGAYFDNIKLSGQPKVERTDKKLQFGWTLFSPHESLPYDWFSVRWTGKLKAPKTGVFNIGIEGNDGYRMYLDGKLLIDNWQKQSYNTVLKPFSFEAGKEYDIKIEFFESAGNAKFKLVWDATHQNEWEQQIAEAVEAAKKSEVAVVVAGIHEGEFQDRALLSLPGHQEALIKAVAKTGKPTVVVLVGGSAITMANWINDVDGIIMAWYSGENGGNGFADVLFGDENPAGRLPVTFPVDAAQCPLYYNNKPTGRGDNYHNLTGQPLFPFGYGLSYTSFDYSDLEFSKNNINPDETITVSFTVKNTGSVDGDEVVQLYIRDELASVSRPIKELKGFQRIRLKAGETKKLSFQLGPEELSMLDKDLKRLVEAGDFRIMIGASSKDIRLRGILTVK
ncbi:glycoside hydrolase family 3 C-terminal domain-containing protein [Mariniflexile gromovii]|uniref:Glycoside hydrolase family 3 C-terminal domain-containing protein n=1 Tax=Mariniflexile gromovii TaxID=362523 RepID=A0ABS4BR15_9FLAO|nr:glycoside hydrolase family 3 N-terminal domain-containing protein [Mariniflexile gromovii]MBP0902977.1 glycoside hydrolase family 3 C-terminal domain-containing protein [Mariniflexile gromovii]